MWLYRCLFSSASYEQDVSSRGIFQVSFTSTRNTMKPHRNCAINPKVEWQKECIIKLYMVKVSRFDYIFYFRSNFTSILFNFFVAILSNQESFCYSRKICRFTTLWSTRFISLQFTRFPFARFKFTRFSCTRFPFTRFPCTRFPFTRFYQLISVSK